MHQAADTHKQDDAACKTFPCSALSQGKMPQYCLSHPYPMGALMPKSLEMYSILPMRDVLGGYCVVTRTRGNHEGALLIGNRRFWEASPWLVLRLGCSSRFMREVPLRLRYSDGFAPSSPSIDCGSYRFQRESKKTKAVCSTGFAPYLT